jgi:hypothetical protein
MGSTRSAILEYTDGLPPLRHAATCNWATAGAVLAPKTCMPNNRQPGPPDSSHDDLSNPGSRRPDTAVTENEGHDRNDDGPGAPYPDPDTAASGSEAEETITKKPLSDMAPPGQDEHQGSE